MGLFASPMMEMAAWNNAQILLSGFCICFMPPFKQGWCHGLSATKTLENSPETKGNLASLSPVFRAGITHVRQLVPNLALIHWSMTETRFECRCRNGKAGLR